MIDVLKAVALGVIEGLTEFLPVSSTGHMILAMPLLGIDETQQPWKAFLFFVQIGAIFAVIVYFGRSLVHDLLGDFHRPWRDRLIVKLAAAFVPAAVIGKLFNDVMERYLEHPLPVAIALVVGAGVMEWIERGHREGPIERIDAVTLRQAVFIGLAQCVSMIPGTSRAMATIFGGLLVGLRPVVAARFSFYLAIPTLCAAGAYRLLKHRGELRPEDASVLGVGFATAFVVALLVVDGFMQYLARRPMRPFAVYRMLLGAAVLGAIGAGWIEAW